MHNWNTVILNSRKLNNLKLTTVQHFSNGPISAILMACSITHWYKNQCFCGFLCHKGCPISQRKASGLLASDNSYSTESAQWCVTELNDRSGVLLWGSLQHKIKAMHWSPPVAHGLLTPPLARCVWLLPPSEDAHSHGTTLQNPSCDGGDCQSTWKLLEWTKTKTIEPSPNPLRRE